LHHLRDGQEIIGAILARSKLATDEHQALLVLQRLIEKMESRWGSICAVCAIAPRTLVHGDFSRKNLRLRKTARSAEIVALDWETAGWGPPAGDLPHSPVRRSPADKPNAASRWNGTVPLEHYAACAGRRWSGQRARDLERLARVGTIFRLVAGIRWAGEQFSSGGTQHGIAKLRWYAELLPQTLAGVDY
jgi:aminoglycoside phosphotransferase (APT) family kinase protein